MLSSTPIPRTGFSFAKYFAFIKRGFLHASSYRLNFVGTYLGAILVVVFFSVLAKFFKLHIITDAKEAQHGMSETVIAMDQSVKFR